MSRVSELRDQVIGWMEFPQTGGADDLDALIDTVRDEALEEAKRFVDNGRFLTDTSMERQWAIQVCKGLEALKGTAPQSPWRPIASAPKDGTWIYVIGPEYETPMPAQWGLLNINPNKYDGAHGWSGNGYIFNDAVYWRPITKDWPEIPVVCENCDGTGRITTDSIGGKQCPECAPQSPAPPTEEAG